MEWWSQDRAAGNVLGAGRFPCLAAVAAAVAVAGRRPDGDDKAAVGVDDDRVAGEHRQFFDCSRRDDADTGGQQDSVHDQYGLLAQPSARPERQRRPEVVDDAVGRGSRDAEQRCRLTWRQACPLVCGDQQHPVLQQQDVRRPLTDPIRALAP
ncbi:hypothetical protein [Streptomyces sp. NRRL S-340]|uniref:hypothetical protein n=1 Tax=Streptomyces sp. NRRL S-340 TaxID=1463901 RepID=UPI000565B3D2